MKEEYGVFSYPYQRVLVQIHRAEEISEEHYSILKTYL